MERKRMSSNRVVGAKQVRKALQAGGAGRLCFALDADPALTEPLAALAVQIGAAVEEIPTMKELGKLCGIEVGAAVAFDPDPASDSSDLG